MTPTNVTAKRRIRLVWRTHLIFTSPMNFPFSDKPSILLTVVLVHHRDIPSEAQDFPLYEAWQLGDLVSTGEPQPDMATGVVIKVEGRGNTLEITLTGVKTIHADLPYSKIAQQAEQLISAKGFIAEAIDRHLKPVADELALKGTGSGWIRTGSGLYFFEEGAHKGDLNNLSKRFLPKGWTPGTCS